jgi:serine protease AprX
LKLTELITRIAIFLFAANLAFARQPKISTELERLDPNTDVDVIVQFNRVPTERHHRKVLSLGGTLRNRLDIVRAGAYSIPALSIGSLADDPEVVRISPDHKLKGMLDITTAAVNASAAWASGWTGKGIGVAVIDSGITPHPDLDTRVVYGKSFLGTGTTNDLFGHGDHVAGIIASSGKSSTCPSCTRTFKGIAPAASLLNLQVLDQNGVGTDSNVIAAIQQAISLQKQYNVRVINLSLGRPIYESYTQDPLCQAVEAAWKAGIVVVVAAGNGGRDNSQGTNGYATITAPGNDPYVVTVGAMKTMSTPDRSDDLVASYSSKGPTLIDHIVKPDIVAPGNKVISLLASISKQNPSLPYLTVNYPQNIIAPPYYGKSPTGGNMYYLLSGTSMATPVVSGTVADLLQAQPTLTPDQVKAKLMLTAYKNFPSTSVTTDPVTGAIYVSQYDMFTVGAGYLDTQAALNDSNIATGTALSPTASYDSVSGDVYLSTDPSAVWNTTAVWDSRAVWGTTEIEATRAVWGTTAVWGTSSLDGFGAVWGTRSVWGTSSTDGAELISIAVNGEN